MDVRPDGDHGGERRIFSALPFVRRSQPISAVSKDEAPKLNDPTMIVAFEGWNDAGEAASYALGYLAKKWDAEPFAEIDPDEFFDFTEVRPEVSLIDGSIRQILWPATVFSVVRFENGHDLVIVRGPEPHLRWRTYSQAVVELAEVLGVRSAITLGAYLSEVTHNRATPVSASSSDPGLSSVHDLSQSLYEGPTGIVGVLSAALADAGVPSMSVWASVPCYSLPVSPKAALALVRVVGRLTERPVDEDEISEEAARYEERMDELIAEDENVAAYVARIEEMEEVGGAEGLAEEIERYLRDDRR